MFVLSIDESIETEKRCVLYAHKFILAQSMAYFQPIFFGEFAESREDDENGVKWISIDPFFEDGIDEIHFRSLINFAYTGSISIDETEVLSKIDSLDYFMGLIVSANRFGFIKLAQICEIKLVDLMKGMPESVEDTKSFANTYNLISLERKCDELLKLHEPITSSPDLMSTLRMGSCVSETLPPRSR